MTDDRIDFLAALPIELPKVDVPTRIDAVTIDTLYGPVTCEAMADVVLVNAELRFRGHPYNVKYEQTTHEGVILTWDSAGNDKVPATLPYEFQRFFKPQAPPAYVTKLAEAVTNAVKAFMTDHADVAAAQRRRSVLDRQDTVVYKYNRAAKELAALLAEYATVCGELVHLGDE